MQYVVWKMDWKVTKRVREELSLEAFVRLT